MTILGIDLGTTNSLVGYYGADGPVLIPNALGEVLTPSVVGLGDDGELLVGEVARRQLLRFPDRTHARFKRHMGTKKVFRLGRRSLVAEELSALVLRSLKADAETNLGGPVQDAVISVPAYFNDLQRRATAKAGELAGLKVLRLINEPTAAALAYGVQEIQRPGTMIVFDLGGGTFDVSILEVFEGVMEVRASAGDAFLGGDDFTLLLARKIAKRLDETWDRLSNERQESLLVSAQAVKHALSRKPLAQVTLRLGGGERTIEISQTEFEELAAPLLARMRRPVERCLYDSGLDPAGLERVILAGGATRMPLVRGLAARLFRQLPERGLDPDQVVALGASVQAGLIGRHAALKDVVMTDVAPFTLGMETVSQIGSRNIGGVFSPIIERNTVLPCSRVSRFWTVDDNQDRMKVRVFQGESPRVEDNLFLDELVVRVPRRPAREESVDVRFTYDVSGLLQVDATVVSTGVNRSLIIKSLASEQMSDAEAQERLRALDSLKVHPRDQAENRALVEALKQSYELALDQDRLTLLQALDLLEAALEGQDTKEIGAMREAARGVLADFEERYVR